MGFCKWHSLTVCDLCPVTCHIALLLLCAFPYFLKKSTNSNDRTSCLCFQMEVFHLELGKNFMFNIFIENQWFYKFLLIITHKQWKEILADTYEGVNLFCTVHLFPTCWMFGSVPALDSGTGVSFVGNSWAVTRNGF